jgi:hypothetical protein
MLCRRSVKEDGSLETYIFPEWGERDITLAEAMELAAPIPQ